MKNYQLTEGIWDATEDRRACSSTSRSQSPLQSTNTTWNQRTQALREHREPFAPFQARLSNCWKLMKIRIISILRSFTSLLHSLEFQHIRIVDDCVEEQINFALNIVQHQQIVNSTAESSSWKLVATWPNWNIHWTRISATNLSLHHNCNKAD